MHIHLAGIDVAPFDIPGEIQRKLLQQLKSFASQFVALALFFANREQSHARTPRAKHAAAINFAHHGELFEIVRLAIDVRADVEQDGNRAHRGREYRRQRGTIDAGNSTQHHFGRGHGGARVARGDESGSLTVAHQPQAHTQRGIALGAHRLHSFVVHGDDFAGVSYFNGQAGRDGITPQFGPDGVRRADQKDRYAMMPGGLNRAFNLRPAAPGRSPSRPRL